MRVHTQSHKHFAITGMSGTGVPCPFCKAAATHPCFAMLPNTISLSEQARMERLPLHTVHVERVRSTGHNVY